MSANDNWLDTQNEQRSDYQNIDKPIRKKEILKLLCTKFIKVLAILTVFILIIPPLTYYLVIDQGTSPKPSKYTCMVQETFRVPCGRVNITQEECWNILCCFDPKQKDCYHSIPSRYFYVKNENENIYKTDLKKSPLGTKTVQNLVFTVSERSENLVNLKLGIHKDNNGILFGNDTIDVKKNYEVRVDDKTLSVEIVRKGTEELLLSTSRGPLIVSDKYLEWTLFLSNGSLFGINRNLIGPLMGKTFKHVLYKNKVDHYSKPTIWAYSKGKFHGVSILYEGPLEITIYHSNLVILRSLTMNDIEIELNVGYTPKMLHDQLRKEKNLPPFWTMETHLCRATDTLDLQTIASDFEFDDISTSYCIDENLIMCIMKDKGKNTSVIKSILDDGKNRGKKLFMSLPPHVLFGTDLQKEAEKLGILYQYNGTTYIGSYLNQDVVYPDYSSPNITTFVDNLFDLISQYVTIPIDGLLLKDNWPADDNFLMNGTDFEYFTEGFRKAMSFTLPWNSTSSSKGLHAQAHNSYSTDHLEAIKKFLATKKLDIFLMSASKSHYQTEPVLMENIDSSWDQLQNKLETVLFESVAGDHLVTVPICGDTQNYDPLNEMLCIRWYLIAATMPMLRISSVSPWRDPKHLFTAFAKNQALRAIDLRNQLLSYYYTLLSKNEPVIRPMFYDFYYDDDCTINVDNQYMIGDNILVTHPFTSGRKSLHVCLPRKIGIWYEIWGGKLYNSTVQPWVNIAVVENDFVAFLAQGTILPLKVDNQINLIVAEDCSNSCEAKVDLFLEDYINFSSNDTHLTISNIPSNCNYTIGYIQIYGYPNQTATVKYYDEKNIQICNGKGSICISY